MFSKDAAEDHAHDGRGTTHVIMSHSVMCFLEHLQTDADLSTIAQPESSRLLSADRIRLCCCDFFTETAHREEKSAFFLSRSPISTLFAAGPDGKETRRPR